VNVDPLTGEVEVVLPRRAPARLAGAAVAELRTWIDNRVAEATRAGAAVAARGGTVPYLGRVLTMVPQDGRKVARIDGDRLLVPAGDPTPAIERLYRRCARAEIEPRLDHAVAALGASYSALRIGGQRTRWGSCSTAGTLSFNWRLLLAGEDVLDYVVWHEACHLLVMDHSSRFWELLERHLPDYRRPQSWLRAHGPTLTL
jgi:predicted metal-dependent hydrolase